MRLQWMQAIYVQMFEYIFTPAEKKTRLMLQDERKVKSQTSNPGLLAGV